MPTWPSPRSEQLGTPNPPRNPFHAGQVFRGFPIHAFATACQVARSPVRIRPTRSAPGSFYFQASNGSVALPVAGYDYNSDWTPLLAGLSPARMAASLAAPDPYVQLSRIRFPPWVSTATICCRMRASICDTLIWPCVPHVLCWPAFLLVSALGSTGSAANSSAVECSAAECNAF